MQDGLGQEGVGDLTEKEKETLRLLLSGHDTKSTASTLGLSVYTINDRLRSARRKLVSVHQTSKLPGVPEGDYVVLQFTTAFAIAAESVETVIMQDEDEGLKTVGYFVR